jgi:hypothetical protein
MNEIGFTQVVSRGCGIDVHKKVVVEKTSMLSFFWSKHNT